MLKEKVVCNLQTTLAHLRVISHTKKLTMVELSFCFSFDTVALESLSETFLTL
jgi:hypothetical protein